MRALLGSDIFVDYCTVFGVHSFRQVLDYHIVSRTVVFVVSVSRRFARSGSLPA
jgi:hypothetical protein